MLILWMWIKIRKKQSFQWKTLFLAIFDPCSSIKSIFDCHLSSVLMSTYGLFLGLFDLILYVTNFSVMSGRVFTG